MSDTETRVVPTVVPAVRGGRGRMPPRTPSRPNVPGRRPSTESGTTRPRPMVSPGPVRTPPPLPQRNGSPSVFSGREGSTFTRRGDTITSPPPAELELFAHHCRVFFWNDASSSGNVDDSADYISRTLAKLPPAHRAAYTRVQSQVRAQAHLHHLRVRISNFHALIAANAPNSGLSGPARSDLTGRRAQSERIDRLSHFVRTWGGSAGALEPFFRGLWTTLRLQSRGDTARGGAGSRRLVWEIDDAVFLESGGPEFMHEAIAIIKGVLGFDEQPLSDPPKLRRMGTTTAATADTRNRAGSDPFTDAAPPPVVTPQPRKTSGRGPAPPPPPSRRRVSPTVGTGPPTGSSLEARWGEDPTIPLLSPASPNPASPASPNPASPVSPALSPPSAPSPAPSEDDDEAEEEADLNKARFRIWVFPAHITDQEAENLMSFFPKDLQRPDPRFPLARRRLKDLELGSEPWTTVTVEGVQVTIPKVEAEDEAGVVRSSTGRIWIGTEERNDGWPGSTWFRFRRWWRRLFGRG